MPSTTHAQGQARLPRSFNALEDLRLLLLRLVEGGQQGLLPVRVLLQGLQGREVGGLGGGSDGDAC